MFIASIRNNRSQFKAAIFTLVSMVNCNLVRLFIPRLLIFATPLLTLVLLLSSKQGFGQAQPQPPGMSGTAQSKNYIAGIVLNGENNAAIPNTSVFITNTSRGTISGTDGKFQLNNIPPGKYELIISSIGYNTQVYPFSSDKLPLQLKIYLEPKATELATVVVEPYEKDGWKRWGTFFIENFIGTTDAAKLCRIKNYKTLRFRHSKKRNVLTVVADEPLIIENRELGYKITYQLENFSYDFGKHTLFFLGYTLFEDMAKDKDKIPKRFLRERGNAYKGSMVHFMRSLYTNRLAEEGFEVRRMVRIPNTEKERIKHIMRTYRAVTDANGKAAPNLKIHGDSTEYYNRVLGQKDYEEVFSRHTLNADSLVSYSTDGQCVMFFNNFLQVMYRLKVEEPAYLAYTMESRPAYHPRSVVFLVNGEPLTIEKNGSYQPPTEFFSSGYWAWNEKISHLLPADYDEAEGR
jgi:hypothetical protein